MKTASRPHLLIIGGEDHHLRIPFIMELKKRGFNITAAGSCDPARFNQAAIPYHRYSFNRFVNPLADLKAIRDLCQIILQVGPSIIQSFDTKPDILVPVAARLAKKAPVVRTVNGLGWVYSSESFPALALRPVLETLLRLTAAWTAHTVFQNNDDKQYFERQGLIGAGSAQLIPGSGVEIEGFEKKLNSAGSADLRSALGLGTSEVVITVARLARIKGIHTLLDAAALVHKRRPNVRFLLVGSRESEGRMAIEQAELDRHAEYVIATGPRSDVPALLNLADVFAFPSQYREGVPRVLLEAALAGVPIVTTAMPGCVDIVQHRVSGLLVPPGDAPTMADGIIELLADRESAKAMANCAREHVKQTFDLQKTVDSYAATYRKLADQQAWSFEVSKFDPPKNGQVLRSP
jgi:glycosyltransferase involved in cell wall biosynthesis